MKRSLFITSSIGVAAPAMLPARHRLVPRSFVIATSRLAARASGSTPGRCHANRSATRWEGFTLADMID